MPKIAYIDKNFRSDTLETIEISSRIIDEYMAQGYALTVRQLYYRLVARGYIPNRQKEYNRLVRIINDARLAGLIDWHAIEDRTRGLQGNGHWESPSDIFKAVTGSFMIDRWQDQPWHVEVWVEKDALIGVVGRIARELDINYFSCRGYSSQSEMWRAGRRIQRCNNRGQNVLVIHLADHDPSGIDMTRDITDRLDLFVGYGDIEVKRIALNMGQVELYNPPPNPAKTTDSRYGTYILQFGGESWELDALEPRVISDLIESTTLQYRDDQIWEETLAREQDMIGVLEQAEDLINDLDEWQS